MAGRPAARVLDPVIHPLPGVLQPGPGSFNVIIGYKPAWRGVPAGAAAAIKSAKQASDAVLKTAKAATTAASGTPAAPAAKLAEETAKTAALAAMGSMITGMSGGADIHMCATPLPLPPHGPGVVVDGSPTVLINGLPACRQGDTIIEALGPPNKIVMGQYNVLIGNTASPSAPGAESSIMDIIGDAIEDAVEAVEDFFNPDVTTGLGAEVDVIVNMSPTLKAKLNALQADGWVIETRTSGGSECDKTAKKITIDTSSDTNMQVTTLAHEAGHATYTPDPYVGMDDKTRQEYIDANVKSQLKDEGEATLTNLEVREEIKDAGGPTIPIAGNPANHPQYEQDLKDYRASADDDARDKAREAIGGTFADGEKTSTTNESYRDYYGHTYEKHWDDHHPAPPATP